MQITIVYDQPEVTDPPPNPEPDLIHPAAPGPVSQWPDIVLSYECVPDFPAFKSYQDERLPLREPCFGDVEIDSIDDCDRDRPASPTP
jgi:hypothetical protein